MTNEILMPYDKPSEIKSLVKDTFSASQFVKLESDKIKAKAAVLVQRLGYMENGEFIGNQQTVVTAVLISPKNPLDNVTVEVHINPDGEVKVVEK